MAGSEVLVVGAANPRKKKGRKVHHKKHRRHVARAANPTHRKRHYRRHNPGRKHGRRRYVRNPRLPFGINFPQILGVSAGLIGTELAGGWLANMLPAEWKKDANAVNMVRIGSKAVVGVGLPLVLKGMLPRGLGAAIAIGGGVAVVFDLFTTFVGPAVGLTGYEYGQLGAFETESIGELTAGDSGEAFAQGAF